MLHKSIGLPLAANSAVPDRHYRIFNLAPKLYMGMG
jgi:hypothetical protein